MAPSATGPGRGEEASAAAPGEATRRMLDALLSRRSVSPKRMAAPGPSDDEIRTMIAMALTAPDHEGLRPYRFIRIADRARDRLASVFEEIRRHADPDADATVLRRERDKAMNGPCLLAVVGRIRADHPDVPSSEQYAAIGAAVMAVLLTAYLLGYGAMMLSGERVRHPLLAATLGIDAREELIGFIAIGTVDRPPPPKHRPDPDEVLTTWEGIPAADGRR